MTTMSEWAEGYDAGYATGTADGAKATNDFTKRRIKELETENAIVDVMGLIEKLCDMVGTGRISEGEMDDFAVMLGGEANR